MNITGIKSAVTYELAAVRSEHNEWTELEELANHLQFELNKVIARQVELSEFVADDDLRVAMENHRDNSDDDDERDAEDDDSDHVYDPYAFADGH